MLGDVKGGAKRASGLPWHTAHVTALQARDLAFDLAEHAATTPFAAIPQRVLEHLACDLVDSLGTCLGGLRAPGVAEAREVIGEGVREGRAVVFGTPLCWPAAAAAQANATAGHALDFDDTLDEGGGMHAGVPVHTAALAIADELGGVNGERYLAAACLGLDVAVRLALAPSHDYGWHRTAAFGVFGVAAAAGRLLGLGPVRMRHALGIAYSQASGNRQCIDDGALSKRLQAGFAARDGVTAARLAQRGLTGATRVFEGANGFFALYQRCSPGHPAGGYDRESVLCGLGQEFLSARIALKPYPCGRNLHAAADAALALAARAGNRRAERVTVRIGGRGARGSRSYPEDVVQAQFSLPFAVALAIGAPGPREGRLSIGAIAEPGAAPEEVKRCFGRVEVIEWPESGGRTRVEVTYADGSADAEEVGAASGNPSRPLTLEHLRAKFHDCNRAGQALPPERADRVIEAALGVAGLADVRELTALLGG